MNSHPFSSSPSVRVLYWDNDDDGDDDDGDGDTDDDE